MEDHRGREAVDEFGLKGFLDLFQHGFSGGDLTVEADGRLAGFSLEKALLTSMEGSANYLRSSGKTVHPLTLQTIAWLKTLPETK